MDTFSALQEGITAYNQKNYVMALERLKPLAEVGNAKAQLFLGAMYEEGCGVEQNHTEAEKWYTQAAEQGDAEAQFNLGLIYLKGRNIFTGSGVDKDLDAAKKWFTLAANQGDTDAQKTLEKFFKR